jgi:hypothetical protein
MAPNPPFSTSEGLFWLRRSKVPQDAEPSSVTSFSIEGLTLCDSLAFLLSVGFGVPGHHHFCRSLVLESNSLIARRSYHLMRKSSVICGLVVAEKESQAESEIRKLQIARTRSQKSANTPLT